ncbi:hypothetical protein OQA88_5211 [Cercophora sp. LCS_1]
MSPTPSIKESISSSSPITTSPHCSSTTFPPSAPARRAYLLARTASAVLGLTQILCAAAAFSLLSRRRWLDPCLSPAITTLIYSSIEVFSVLYWNGRAHHLTRALYDGIIWIGFAVATGFFVMLAAPSFQGQDESGGIGAAVLGGAILGCMLSQIIIHGGISLEGIKDTLMIRGEKKARNRNLAV